MPNPSLPVLLVEDNDGYSYITRRLLQQLNDSLDVHVARDTDEALAFVQRQLPSLILLDLVLPTRSGLELLQELKRDDATATIPTIVLTGFGDDQHVWNAYQRFANAVLVKPDTPDGLLDVLAAVNDFWFRAVLLPPARPADSQRE